MASGFEGMEGMEGMMGTIVAPSGGSDGGFFADRVDLPFVTIDWAPGKPIAREPPIDIARYPLRNWSADWYPWLVLTQFAHTGWDRFKSDLTPAWASGGIWNSPSAMDHVQVELDDLIIAAQDERASALGEILGQADGFGSYFLDLLTATGGYPATAKVVTIANTVGGFCAMYYKGVFMRPRPPMLTPALLPPIPAPGHASFPSGHATQAHLMALCLNEVLEGTPQASSMLANMKALADRIARNREIAGLHYPSDSQAGVVLAGKIHHLLTRQTSVDPKGDEAPTWYRLAIAAAKQEWS